MSLKSEVFVFCFYLLSLVILQSCATPNKPLVVNKFQKITSVKMVRHESPPILSKTAGSQAVALIGVMLGAIGDGL